MGPISLKVYHLLLFFSPLYITSCKSYITSTYDLNFMHYIFLYIKICAYTL